MSNTVSNTQKLTDIVVLSHVKRRMKSFFSDKTDKKISLNMFPQFLTISMITLLEELLTDSIKYVTKSNIEGLYVIDMLIINNVINSNKYNIFNKYIKQYSNILYEDSLFFNLKKVISKLESKHGDKLMINPETRRFISFLLVSIQYDICDLALKFLLASGRVTINKNIVALANEYIIGDEINNKIKLKLDCIIESKSSDDDKSSDKNDENDIDNDGIKENNDSEKDIENNDNNSDNNSDDNSESESDDE
jgi:hypothetical protein